jgi:hypothetical protein
MFAPIEQELIVNVRNFLVFGFLCSTALLAPDITVAAIRYLARMRQHIVLSVRTLLDHLKNKKQNSFLEIDMTEFEP